MKLLPLFFFSFATSSVLAEKQTLYSCYNKNAAKHKLDPEVQKIGGIIDDASVEEIISNMAGWSGDKYTARFQAFFDIVYVGCGEKTMGTEKLTEEIAEMERTAKEREGHG